jgi:hypothetical protein
MNFSVLGVPEQGSAARPLRLVLPAAAFTASRSASPALPGLVLHHGPLVLQPTDGALLALVPRLLPGPPRALPPFADALGPRPGRDYGRTGVPEPTALALVVHATADHLPPGATAPDNARHDPAARALAWDAWLARHAPEHRLAARARIADLLLLWCTPQGPAFGLLRRGDAWARLERHAPWTLPVRDAGGIGAGEGRWVPVAQIHLPGAGMRRLALPAAGAGVDSAPAVPPPSPAQRTEQVDESRHSRQALALTPPVLTRLQGLRVGIVGAGLEGAALASSLVRLGAQVRVLDAATMFCADLDADLAPWLEGQPRVSVDGRQLPPDSPAAGSLLAGCDIVVATASGEALERAEAWALATLQPLLAIATRVLPASDLAPAGDAAVAEAWVALLPPGHGCLRCIGRWPSALRVAGAADAAPALRSWSVLAAHMGLRLLEHLVAGRIGGAVLRHLRNGQDGSLQVRDLRAGPGLGPSAPGCPRCAALSGAGSRAAGLARSDPGAGA